MTKDEVLRMALEALEEIGDEWGFTSKHTVPNRKTAITAIKEALAQPEQEPVAVARVDDLERGGRVRALAMGLSLDAPLYTTPPQPKEPEQEPVAYLDEGLGAFYFAKQYKKNVGFTPLYTTPPQREWVGLTDEEVIKQANKEQNPESFARGVLWAEAKLKEKNT